jgi:hypothetical protein
MNIKRTMSAFAVVAAGLAAVLGASLLLSPPPATQALEQANGRVRSFGDGSDDRSGVAPSPSESESPSPEPSPSATDDDDFDDRDDDRSGPGHGDDDDDDNNSGPGSHDD